MNIFFVFEATDPNRFRNLSRQDLHLWYTFGLGALVLTWSCIINYAFRVFKNPVRAENLYNLFFFFGATNLVWLIRTASSREKFF